MRLFVAIATTGRPDVVAQVVKLLSNQTCPPDGVIVAAASREDVARLDPATKGLEIVFSERGGCHQRNRALDVIGERAEVVTFFDDDFVPAPDYLAEVRATFAARPEVVGVTGELIADGIHDAQGFTVEEALDLIEAQAAAMPRTARKREALYGCNMSIRMSAAEGLRFDEMLPLYSWQEDIDFTFQLGRRGELTSSGRITGVHMGNKRGRSPGKRFGYSQVANIVYLKRKGTMQPKLGERLLFQNILGNLVHSLRPEPHIDRRGRLLGNLLAIRDLVLGRIDPRRILTM